MTYKVTLSSSNVFNVKLKTAPKINVQSMVGGVQVPANFSDLGDYNPTGLSDKYVIMYDAATQKYIPVNPDEVLNAAASTELTQPGLVGFATAFLDRVDVDLDDRIDLDAGSF
jgi:hypothetical protein